MNRPIRHALLLLALVTVTLAATMLAATPLHAQLKDSVELIEQPGSAPYRCCYTFVVENRQSRPSKISEFSVRIVSGRATFAAGTAGSPPDWTVFVASDLKSVTWFASSTTSEIDSGVSKSGFAICAQDTGIVRLVWETRTLDTVYSSDTLVAACRGVDCDEAFFRRVPSNEVCIYDVDVVGGNRRGVAINDIRLKMLTPGVTFSQTSFTLPTGWTRPRISSDSVQFFTMSSQLDFGEFVEGLRFEALDVTDSFRVLYQTYSNGELVCTDTARLACTALERSDSVQVRHNPGCCSDLRLSNTHMPGSPLDRFVVSVLTAGVRISGTPTAPTGWTRGALPPNNDSVFYTRSTGMATGDTALFRGLCFDNSGATNDTIRYRWTTYSAGLPIATGLVTQTCLRPLTRCDSVTARTDSIEGAAPRCVTLRVANRNSREETITRIVARISNPGTARRILTATAPGGWQVVSVTRDSVVFTGELFADDVGAFELCVTADDTTMGDPMTIAWRTEGASGALCSGTIPVTIRIVRAFDIAVVEEIPSSNPDYCCYSIGFANRNDRTRTLSGFQLEVVNTNVLFGDATAAGGWTVATSGFPAPQVGFAGATLAPGDTTPRFTFCIDARNVSGRPATIPITWRSFAGDEVVTTERLDLNCVGGVQQLCDTAIVRSATPGELDCTYGFDIANVHTPAGTIDRVRFRVTAGTGEFTAASASGEAAPWTMVAVRPDTVTFSGSQIVSGDTVGSFNVTVGNAAPATRSFEICTYGGETLACCDIVQVECGSSGIAVPTEPSGFRLGEASPNPFSEITTVPYELRRAASVALVIRDDRGRVVRRIDDGRRDIGRHEIVVDAADLSSGLYFYTLEAGNERFTRRMLIVR